MIHLEVQPQSLCLRPHFAHSQYVHQIHFRWFSQHDQRDAQEQDLRLTEIHAP